MCKKWRRAVAHVELFSRRKRCWHSSKGTATPAMATAIAWITILLGNSKGEINDGPPSDVDTGESNTGKVVSNDELPGADKLIHMDERAVVGLPNVADKFENSSISKTEGTSLVQHLDIDTSSQTDTTEDSGNDGDDDDDDGTEHTNKFSQSDSEDGVEIDTFADCTFTEDHVTSSDSESHTARKSNESGRVCR